MPRAAQKLTPKRDRVTCSAKSSFRQRSRNERARSGLQRNQSGSSAHRCSSSASKQRHFLPVCVVPKLPLLSDKKRQPASLLRTQSKPKSRVRKSSSSSAPPSSRTKTGRRQVSKASKELPICVVPKLPTVAGRKRPSSCQSTKTTAAKRARRSRSRAGPTCRPKRAKSVKVGKTHKKAISRSLERAKSIRRKKSKVTTARKSMRKGRRQTKARPRGCAGGGRSAVPKAWKQRLRPRPLKSLRTPCFTYGCQRCKARLQARASAACGSSASNASAYSTLAHRICDYIPGCSYLRKRWFNSSGSNTFAGRLSSRRRRRSRIVRATPITAPSTAGSSNEDMSTAEGSISLGSVSDLHGPQLELSPQFNLLKRPLVHSVGGDEPDTVRIQL